MRRAAIRTTSVSTGALSISISAGRRRPSSTILIFFAEYLLSCRPADVVHNLQPAS
jgi:hypothetical protein